MRHLIIVGMAIMLMACSNVANNQNEQGNDSRTNENNTTETNKPVTNESDSNEAAQDDGTPVDEPNEMEEKEDSEMVENEFQELEEYDTIDEEVDLENTHIDIVEDNYGKRVLLISNEDGEEKYKTIYIKNKNRLKIIELDKDDGEIFNEEIK